LAVDSSEADVPAPDVDLHLGGGLPPSVSALSCPSSGALPSSGSASAQARSGAASSPAATVVVGAAAAAGGAGAAGAVVAGGAFGVSLGPPPHAAAPSATRAATRAEQTSLPFMNFPPGPGFL